MRRIPSPLQLALVLSMAAVLADAPAVSAAENGLAVDAADEALALDVGELVASLLPGLRTELPASPATRPEPDGSVTVLGNIEDLSGPTTRRILELDTAALATSIPNVGAPSPPPWPGEARRLGIFDRAWDHQGIPMRTFGVFVVDADGDATNLNLLVVEGAPGLLAAAMDVAEHDLAPLAYNILPFVANYAFPTSITLVLVGVVALLALAILAGLMAGQGYTEIGGLLMYAGLWVLLAPLFYVNVLYPVHRTSTGDEAYRDHPDVYLWDSLRRAAGSTLWQGTYLDRKGAYSEATESRADGTHLVASAWKRQVVGPVVRIDAATNKLPGAYLRQDIQRDDTFFAAGGERFTAEDRVTAGAYDPAVGETPGASVRFDETKSGDQALMLVPHQRDTIALGVTVDGAFVPLLGTRTESRHRPYTDTTNQGAPIAATESYRVTSVGFFAGDEYVPVAGADHWGERNPADAWVLALALGLQGPGDQTVGDFQARVGVFNPDGRFVPVAGARWDDDFAGHRHTYRTMVSAGLFVADPLDPGAPVPGQAPDGAMYAPLLGTTYDGVRPAATWAQANAANAPSGMGAFLVSAGVFAGTAYVPVVGVEHRPEAYQGQRAARESYDVGVFAADYAAFVPLAGVTYDGQKTSAAWAARLATSNAGQGSAGPADTTQGVHAAGAYVPLSGAQYRSQGTPARAFGHTVTIGAYDPAGAFVPLLGVTVGFTAPPGTLGPALAPCHVQVRVTVAPLALSADSPILPCGA